MGNLWSSAKHEKKGHTVRMPVVGIEDDPHAHVTVAYVGDRSEAELKQIQSDMDLLVLPTYLTCLRSTKTWHTAGGAIEVRPCGLLNERSYEQFHAFFKKWAQRDPDLPHSLPTSLCAYDATLDMINCGNVFAMPE